jgi:penicillin-binding protein 1A
VLRQYAARLAITTLGFVVLFVLSVTIAVRYLSRDLPDLAELERIRPALMTTVYSRDGEVLKNFSIQKRTLVPYAELPPELIDALLSSEDRQFRAHWGLNILGLIRAVYVAIQKQEGPRATSTITQQLARDLFLTRERSLLRKAKEAILAVRIERTYTKEEILQLYLNQVYFGAGAYGVEAAAHAYFGKDAKDLSIVEGATLVGMLPAPAWYHPIKHPESSKRRRDIVLRSMRQTGALTSYQVVELQAVPMETQAADEEVGIAPYFTEYIRLRITDDLFSDDSVRVRYAQQLGLPDSMTADRLFYEGGLVIETTLDSRLQSIAEDMLTEQLSAFQLGIDTLAQADPDSFPEYIDHFIYNVDSLSGDTLGIDSVVTKTLQAGLVSLDTKTGAILAMVGGRDFEESKFNRAVQALRQPGSAFKPFVYTAAIDNGWTPVDQILDQPITVTYMQDSVWYEWRPQNYGGGVGGMTTLRDALRRSKNLVAIRLLQQISPRIAIKYARKMGISTRLPAVPVLPLGVGEVYLLELTASYTAYPNNGIVVKPFPISRIASREGAVLMPKRTSGERTQALSEQTAYIMTTMLQDAILNGTGGSSRWKYRFYHDAGGKTGTTNDYHDAWFVGFTPHIVTGVWVGFDKRSNTHHTGASGALPIWARYMKAAHGVLGFPDTPFEMPSGVIAVTIDDSVYQKATRYCPSTYEEYFREGAEPVECRLHSLQQGGTTHQPSPRRTEPSGSRTRF